MNKQVQLADVKVTNYNELLAALTPFMPNSKSTIREELIRGFDVVKERMIAYDKSVAITESADFGGHPPAKLANPENSKFWLDQFVERRMGGKRIGLFVQWSLPIGTYRFEPYTGKLEKV